MIRGIHDFYYNVKNMEKAVQFYTETLNMKVTHESEHWTSLDCDGVMIGGHMLIFEDMDGNVLKLQNAKY